MERTIRLCLTNLAHDHAWWTLEHIKATPGVELVGVADTAAHRRKRFSEGVGAGVPLFDSVEAMLDEAAPDGLVVTSPNDEHRAAAEAALRRDVACMVQKPISASLDDAKAMAAAAARSNAPLMVNFFPLWQPVRAEFFRRLAAGTIGDIRHLSVWNGHQGPTGINVLTEDYKAWLYDVPKHGGRALADQASYGIAYAVWMLGRPLRVSATEVVVLERTERRLDDIATVTLEYPHAVAQLQGSWGWPHRLDEMRCLGTTGSLHFAYGEMSARGRSENINDLPELTPIEVHADSVLGPANGIQHFVRCLRTGEPIWEPHTPAVNLLIAEVTDAALRAATARRSIAL